MCTHYGAWALRHRPHRPRQVDQSDVDMINEQFTRLDVDGSGDLTAADLRPSAFLVQ